jgi:16S rRNA processing protein RimM
LRVPAASLRALGDNAHYVHDLEGCEVRSTGGELVGTVVRVERGPGTPLLVVADARGREVLVPLAADICRTIDPAGKRIVVNLPEGLLDLNA